MRRAHDSNSGHFVKSTVLQIRSRSWSTSFVGGRRAFEPDSQVVLSGREEYPVILRPSGPKGAVNLADS